VALVALFGALLYLNRVGLPDFLKRQLLEKLRARGIELGFSRLRLSWRLGVVADDVRFGQADRPFSPYARFAQVRLQINHHALLRRQLQVDALVLREGRLMLPVPQTNGPVQELTLDHIETYLRFLPDDQWSLDDFTAGFSGARLQLSGTLAHASAARDWKFLQPQGPPHEELSRQWQARLRDLADTLRQIHFEKPALSFTSSAPSPPR
jgi:hypothetical protein